MEQPFRGVKIGYDIDSLAYIISTLEVACSIL